MSHLDHIWLTADTHFGHNRMATFWRGFETIEEHDESLAEFWTDLVKPGDEVYVVGDVFWTKAAALHYAPILTGQIHVVPGNHDKKLVNWLGVVSAIDAVNWRAAQRWSIRPPILNLHAEGERIVLCHYRLSVWENAHDGWLHAHGHSHGNFRPPYAIPCEDVGVDPLMTYFGRPLITAGEFIDWVGSRRWTAVDHHGVD